MSAARYPPLAGFLIAPEHSASEGTSMRCCDWEEGASGCWSCLPGTAGWDLWGMEPWCLAHTPESTLFPPCTCRREPPAKVDTLLFLKYERLAHAGLADSGCHEATQEKWKVCKDNTSSCRIYSKVPASKVPNPNFCQQHGQKRLPCPLCHFWKKKQSAQSFHSESGLCQTWRSN